MIIVDDINKHKLYWTLQGIGWFLFYVVYVSIAGYSTSYRWEIFAGYLNTVVVGLLLTHWYRYYIKKNKWIDYGMLKLTMVVTVASFLIAILWAGIILPINKTFFSINEDRHLTIFLVIIITFQLFTLILAWSLIYFLFQLFTNFKKTEVEKWKLEAAVKDAQLIALKSQINPHFIFNSLNNIRSLVVENPEKARDMITHLSGLLRYSIQFNNTERVSLEHELEVVQNYLNLESIQLEKRLKYKFEIKPETLDAQIPPMAVQLLVENAIKHGISNLPEGGVIHIKSNLERDTVIIEVINSGQMKKQEERTGIGLKNASDRLELFFGRLSDLKVQNLDDKFVSAKFTVPLIL